jgi:hypothetical protein
MTPITRCWAHPLHRRGTADRRQRSRHPGRGTWQRGRGPLSGRHRVRGRHQGDRARWRHRLDLARCRALDPDRYPLQPHYRREHWPLVNSVYLLADGNILASLRSVSAVIIIGRGTGKVIWHLGPGTVAQQHCASELPDGSILLFDNGTFGRRSPSPTRGSSKSTARARPSPGNTVTHPPRTFSRRSWAACSGCLTATR